MQKALLNGIGYTSFFMFCVCTIQGLMSCKFVQIPGHVECLPKHMLYSSKQHLFFVVFELIGTTGSLHEVVIYWEPTDIQSPNNKGSLIKGFLPHFFFNS